LKILISDSISEDAVNLLKNSFSVDVEEVSAEKLKQIINNYDALIVRSRTKVTKEVIEAGKNLKVIGRAGIGVDNIDVKSATEKNIPVVFAPRGSTLSVAEITVAQILALSRQLIYADRTTKEGKWLKRNLMGVEIYGKTLGLIGMGRIGIEVAKRCQAFGMSVIAFDPFVTKEVASQNNIELLSDVSEIYKKSDFISIHALLTKDTKGMINKTSFQLMKKSTYIINYSRGGIINEDDLIEALETSQIAGAALDVFEEEPIKKDSKLLKDYPNLHLTPHIGASTIEAQDKAGLITAQGVLDRLNNKRPEFCVNESVLKN
jgi:D-3-phosphoglycerate dehydrogenase